jgi:transketolase
MRNAFNDVLIDIARKDESLVLLVGDIGFRVFDDFRDEFPDRFYNVGIAEANMIGVAAGLAMTGMKPVVYTIIPFLVMRAFEQIRVDLCIQDLPVILVGVGGGLSYDTLGPTHHAIEDLAIMRSLPNMQVLTPCDPQEVVMTFREGFSHKGPTFLRLGKGGEENLLTKNTIKDRVPGKINTIKTGRDILFICCGPILKETQEAVDILSSDYDCGLINIHSLKPLDTQSLADNFRNVNLIVTVEEHSIIGGVGSAVAEIIAQSTINVQLLMIGIPDIVTKQIGKRDYLLKGHNMDSKSIAKRVHSLIVNRRN